MSQRKVLYQWTAMVSNHFAELSLAQVKTLAAFSLGLGLAQRCALGAVSWNYPSWGEGKRWNGSGGASSAIPTWSWPVAVRC